MHIVSIQSKEDFQSKINILNKLLELREEPRNDIEQRYITTESVINKLNAMDQLNLLDGRRVLAIGDADLSALSVSIFGNPTEVVVTDIDDRLSELLFEANLEYDLPVRFVYHDMRIKIIEILLRQYSLILMEPPHSKAGVEVFISRAIKCLDQAFPDGILITIPSSGPIREFFNNYIAQVNLQVLKSFPKIVQYQDSDEYADFIQLGITDITEETVSHHFILPFYAHEEDQEVHEYKCICRKTFKIGPGEDYQTIEELESRPCPDCGYDGKFAFVSEIKLV